jgi:hypothetical protein
MQNDDDDFELGSLLVAELGALLLLVAMMLTEL